jgi:GntR family transcriptional regulator / MocR family aminotransferase
LLWISLDRSKPVPLIPQIYTDIRAKILRGELSAGDKLPSTRKLSEELRISRNVVLEAYDLLLAEGYLESRRGSGHFVGPLASASKHPPRMPRGAYVHGRRLTATAMTA